MTDFLPIAVRAYSMAAEPKRTINRRSGTVQSPRVSGNLSDPDLVLVFDTETTTDVSQQLNFGSYLVLRGHRKGYWPIAEGLFYADDLSDRYPEGHDALSRYVSTHDPDVDLGIVGADHRLEMISASEFRDRVLYQVGWRKRGMVVAFNLPFDLSRIAIGCSDARNAYTGGFSLQLFEYQGRPNRYRPNITVKHLTSKKALVGFTDAVEADDPYAFRGHFLDLRTLTFAHTNGSHSLRSAGLALKATLLKEAAEEGHGKITSSYIDYARRDTKATAALFVAARNEHKRHPIQLQMTKAFSPASIAKAYLDAMGVTPIMQRQPDFPLDILGFATTTYYGGRAECRIRKTPVPVELLDFLSMYPTVNTLEGLWELLTANRMNVEESTAEIQQLLDEISLDDCFRRETWRSFVGIAQIEADGDILPVRARFSDEPTWNIGVSELTTRTPTGKAIPLWYTIADLVASKILTGKPSTVIRGHLFTGDGKLDTLQPTKIRGTIKVDPTRDDLFKFLVETRNSGGPDFKKGPIGQSLKVLANAGSYGIFVEMTPWGRNGRARLFGLPDEPWERTVSSVEVPGRFSFPPLGACITGGARLMLAMLERCVSDAGGSWAFCDTDSMAIVASHTGGTLVGPQGDRHKILTYDDVQAIRDRFAQLSPYNPKKVAPTDLLKSETRGHCYAISAKRYAIFDLDADNRVKVDPEHCSEHGLGHLIDPYQAVANSVRIDGTIGDETYRNAGRKRQWIVEAWERLIAEQAYSRPVPEPGWMKLPALCRINVSSPQVRKGFKAYNAERCYADSVKPFNFLFAAQPALPGSDHARYVTPFNSDSQRWLDGPWFNIHDTSATEHTAITAVTDAVDSGDFLVRTYRDIVQEFAHHPEYKAADLTGEPCDRQTQGWLDRRAVRIRSLTHVGKEANDIEDQLSGMVANLDDVLCDYGDGSRIDSDFAAALESLRDLPAHRIAELTLTSEREVKRWRSGKVKPRSNHRKALVLAACRHHGLKVIGDRLPPRWQAKLAAIVAEMGPRTCEGCGEPIERGRWHTDACRKRAERMTTLTGISPELLTEVPHL